MAKFYNDISGELEIKYVDELIEPEIEKSSKLSSGAREKEQISGERINIACRARATTTEMRSLLDLLKAPLARYFYYEPEESHPIYSGVSLPFPAKIYDVKSEWDNREVHYIKFKVKSVEFIA